MKIPVFHDDQHGTAIVAAAAILNGLKLVGKDISKVKLACSGAGAAALACLDLLVSLGLRMENISSPTSPGVVYEGRRKEWTRQGALRADDVRAHPGRHHRRRRHLPRTVGRRRAQAGHGQAHGEGPADPGAGQPEPGDLARKKPRQYGPMPSSRRAAPTIRTRSTTSCAFPSSSAARLTSARRPSTRR